MKFNYLILSLFIYSVSGWPENFSSAKNSHIFCSHPIFDFGSADQSQNVFHTFIIQNIGNNDLIIQKIKSSCHCTHSKIDKRLIPPGESANLNVIMDLKGLLGSQFKTFTIYSNDPAHPVLSLSLKGDVTKLFNVTPDFLSFESHKNREKREKSITIKSINNMPFQISRYNLKPSYFEVEKISQPLPDSITLFIRPTPHKKSGLNVSYLNIILSSPPQYQIRVKLLIYNNPHQD